MTGSVVFLIALMLGWFAYLSITIKVGCEILSSQRITDFKFENI